MPHPKYSPLVLGTQGDMYGTAAFAGLAGALSIFPGGDSPSQGFNRQLKNSMKATVKEALESGDLDHRDYFKFFSNATKVYQIRLVSSDPSRGTGPGSWELYDENGRHLTSICHKSHHSKFKDAYTPEAPSVMDQLSKWHGEQRSNMNDFFDKLNKTKENIFEPFKKFDF